MPNVIIPTDHPDSASPLLHFAAEALAAMGARVEIALGGENLVRSLPGPVLAAGSDRAAQERAHPVACSGGPPKSSAVTPKALVQAEGLPNLLHELAHAVQAGCLADDYGIDYTAIPFDLDTAAGRAVLWDELAC